MKTKLGSQHRATLLAAHVNNLRPNKVNEMWSRNIKKNLEINSISWSSINCFTELMFANLEAMILGKQGTLQKEGGKNRYDSSHL